MSVSITTSTVADLSRIGWNTARAIERTGYAVAYNPNGPTRSGGNVINSRPVAPKQDFYDAVIDEIVADQGGTASTTNVNAALRDQVTPELAISTIAAL